MPPFQAKITKARFVYSPFTAEQMTAIGNDLVKSIQERIHKGLDVNDQRAKPLKSAKGKYVPYARWKTRKGLQPFRDLFVTGRTMRSMKVISANENSGKIGFVDAHSDMVMHVNNLRSKQFGISPADHAALVKSVFEMFADKKVASFRAA